MKFKGWDHTRITLDNGELVDGIAPLIISASRSTDIPAFYGKQFLERIRRGYVCRVNPFNGVKQYVS
ncbi:MAG: DUF1848 domain-containing protein, partial [Fibrobacter sp.]|nr:DUF1848 domain-containing protein [Fibrobacter sp.]